MQRRGDDGCTYIHNLGEPERDPHGENGDFYVLVRPYALALDMQGLVWGEPEFTRVHIT